MPNEMSLNEMIPAREFTSATPPALDIAPLETTVRLLPPPDGLAATQIRPKGLTKNQIAWCDKRILGFKKMRLDAEKTRAATERDNKKLLARANAHLQEPAAANA